MFKNMLKRSVLSTIRKPSRSVILVLILFVMANMLLATVAIKNSVQTSMDYAKEKLGGIVYLTADSDKMRETMEAARTEGSTTTFTTPTISEDLAQGVAESEYLKDYTYSIVASGNASNYTVVATAQNEREQQFKSALDDAKTQAEDQVNKYNAARNQFNADAAANTQTSRPPQDGGGDSAGSLRSFSFNMSFNIADPTLTTGDTTIQGINSYSFISEVEAGTMNMVSGETFDENTTDGAIISQELATANSVNIGDAITIKTTSDAIEISLRVVGIYQSTDESFDDNTVYMNIDTAKKFLTVDQIANLSVSSVRYYLTSASEKDAFLAEMAEKYPEIAAKNLKLDVDDSSYQTMVGPIENVGGFATTVMFVVMAAAVVIITLIVVINIKDRRYEMGVLLSLGAKRTNILGQIFIELIIVGTVGFVLSLATSGLIADKLGEGLLAQQIASTEVMTETASQEVDGGRIMRGASAVSNVQKIDEIDVSAGLTEYLTLFGAGYAILIIAMILPSINILRYQPKTILAGKE